MESGSVRTDLRSLTRLEESMKRNTDCVYFLASPLTCKKGNECEYRHSEGVRVNPRDCKFWFSGNCLNPKCLFRHPPLDGPYENHVASSGTTFAASQVPTSIQLPHVNSPAYNFSRNSVPCYYFQKGTCLKGDKCPFMHRSQPISDHFGKQIVKSIVPVPTELETPKKVALRPDECNSRHNLPFAPILCNESSINFLNGGALSSLEESSMTLKSANTQLIHKSSLHSVPANKPGHFLKQWGAAQSDRRCLKEREAGEIIEEASIAKLKTPLNCPLRSSWYQNDNGNVEIFPEFSSRLDAVKDPGHLHEKDDFRGQRGRKMNQDDAYSHEHPVLESAAWVDRDRHNIAIKFQNYGDVHGARDGELDSSVSVSERSVDKLILPARRLAHRLRSPDGMDESDLRHKLGKKRRLNSSFPATISGRESSDTHDRHALKSHEEQHQLFVESAITSRLRGRIALPNSSPELLSDFHAGDNIKQRDKLSPLRTSNIHGRLGDRLSQKPVENSSDSQQKARATVDTLSFAGPRSLAELKGAKAVKSSQSQLSKNIHSVSSIYHNGMKPLNAASLQKSNVSYNSPKPLSTILKRNQELSPENEAFSDCSNNKKAIWKTDPNSCTFDTNPVSKEAGMEDFKTVSINAEEITVEIVKEEEPELNIPVEAPQKTYQKQGKGDETEARYTADDEDLDYTSQQDGDIDYKSEDENIDLMNIDDEDEEDDDFAKKIGLIFS